MVLTGYKIFHVINCVSCAQAFNVKNFLKNFATLKEKHLRRSAFSVDLLALLIHRILPLRCLIEF